MDKADFLKKLEHSLQRMDDAENNRFVTYYDEMISDYMENGMAEEEAVDKVGSPAQIARELLAEYDSVKINIPSTGSRVFNIVISIIGFPLWGSVLLAIVLMILSAYVVIWCLPFAAGAGSVGFLASAIIGIIGSPFVMTQSLPIGIMQLGAGIASVGIAVLLGIATVALSKTFIGITKSFNVKLVALFKKKVVIR